MFQIDIGVPQGNALSPLFFIVFLNDLLSNQAEKFKCADAISLIVTCKGPSELSAIRKNLLWHREMVCRLEVVSERRKNWIDLSIAKGMTSISRPAMVIYVKVKKQPSLSE